MAATVGLRVQDKMNILASNSTYSKGVYENAQSLDVLNTTSGKTEQDGWNTYASTTGLRKQDAANVKAGGNVAPTRQVGTITVGGTAETGDVFTVNIDGYTTTYTTVGADTTTTLIAAKINTAIQAHPSYANQPFTTSVSTNVITVTAKTSGIPFSCTASAVDGGGTDDQTCVFAVTTPNVYMFTRGLRIQDAVNLL